MSFLALDHLPPWVVVISLCAHLAAGIVLGLFYFRAVWWQARRFASGGRISTTVATMIGRFLLLGGVLTLASLEGALPLLVTAVGVLVARFAVMRQFREAAP